MQAEKGLMRKLPCGDVARVICIFAVIYVIQQLKFSTQEIQATFDYCYVWRCVELISPLAGIKRPGLR